MPSFIIFDVFDLICRYVPTRLWGFSGHVQTVLHSIVGRVKCPWPLGERVYLMLSDGSTLTYDLYQPLNEHEGKIHSHGDKLRITDFSLILFSFTQKLYYKFHSFACAI